MSDKIVLYDLASKGRCACWSPNVWKTRLVLNYKGIPYRTEWMSHPEIQDKVKELGVQPNTSGQGSPYTVPAIQFPDGSAVMDSAVIASKLESLHPEPSLHLDTGLHEKVGRILGKLAFPLIPVFMPRIGRDVIVESSEAWFQKARAERFGMSLDELESSKGGEKAWEASRVGIAELETFVAEQKKNDGPFVMGSQVCFADFQIASSKCSLGHNKTTTTSRTLISNCTQPVMESLRRIGPDLYEEFINGQEDLKKLHDACQKWMKDDQ